MVRLLVLKRRGNGFNKLISQESLGFIKEQHFFVKIFANQKSTRINGRFFDVKEIVIF